MSTNTNGTDGTLQTFEKNRYFAAKLMTARDMLAEQDYHADRLEAVARYVAGEGIVCGLEVSSVTNDGDELTVELTPGFALDAAGNPIVVTGSGPVVVKHPETDKPALVPGEVPLALYLRYDECSVETVPMPGSESACKQECTYNRIREVFDVVYEEVDPASETAPTGVKTVPEVAFPNPEDLSETEGAIADDDPGLVKMARQYHEDNSATCDARSPPWVFLGVFQDPDGDGEWDQLDPESLDSAFVYTNDLLYAAIARHTADFHNPHRTTLTVAPFESGDVPAGADAYLTSGRTYGQGQTLFFDGRELVETATGRAYDETSADERAFRLRSPPGSTTPVLREFHLDDQGQAVLETADLDGAYVISYPHADNSLVRASATGVGSLPETQDVESVAFAVSGDIEPGATEPVGDAGAVVSIRDDERPAGRIEFHSSNDSVAVDATTGGAETPAGIDLTVSIEDIADQLDAVESVSGVRGDENGNVTLTSETVGIEARPDSNAIELSVPVYDPIERLDGVSADAEGNVDLRSESIEITPQPDSNAVAFELGEINAIRSLAGVRGGEIGLHSETIEITADDSADTIRLEVRDTADGIRERVAELEARVHSVEQTQRKKSIHCKRLSYAVLQERFMDNQEIGEPIENILGVVDEAMDAEDISPEAYLGFIEEVREHERALNERLNPDLMTRPGIERYQTAFERLSAIELEEDNVDELIATQECLSKAAEWLQPR